MKKETLLLSLNVYLNCAGQYFWRDSWFTKRQLLMQVTKISLSRTEFNIKMCTIIKF